MNIKLQAAICIALCSTSVAQDWKPSRQAAGKLIRDAGYKCKTVVSVALVHPDGEHFRARCEPAIEGKFPEYIVHNYMARIIVYSCGKPNAPSECSYSPIASW
jgi:hypothetical protein